SDNARAGDRPRREEDEDTIGDARLERPALHLVERVRADAHREDECEDRPAEDPPMHVRRDGGAERGVREMPQGVRGMEKRDVVAPSARTQRVEGGTDLGAHERTPHMTTPPPRPRRRVCTSRSPASRHSCSSDTRAWTSRMLGPRKPPTSRQPGETIAPASGRPTRTYSSHSIRQIPRGTSNSSIATTPPGRTTRGSSCIVASGSST